MKKFFLFAALAFTAPAFAQKAGGKLKFPKGQKLEVVSEAKIISSVELMGQSMETTVNTMTSEMYDIEDANDNGAKIEHKVKRLTFNTEGGMAGSQSFDSEKESDMKGDVGKALEKTIKNKYTMQVDANGKVTEVTADNKNPNPSSSDDEMSKMMSSQLGLNAEVPKAGAKTIFAVLPAAGVAQGDTWTDTLTLNGRFSSTVYKVTSVSSSEILLDYTEDGTIKTTQEIMGQEAVINGTDKTTGTIVLDRSSGLLKKRTGTSERKATMEAQGMSIPVSAKTSFTITVK